MEIEIIVNHKKFQPMIEGINFPPENYTINITRSDGRGLTELEVLTALQSAVEGIKTSVVKER